MPDISGWPTDSGAGSVSTEARWRSMARLWAPDGVADGYLGGMAPSYAGGNVTVQSGGAWVDGHYCEQLSSSSVAVSTNGLVVVRFTPADNRFQIVWVNGAVSPTQTAGTWELPLARMTASSMTDVRTWVRQHTVTSNDIANDAVVTGKIADGAVTAEKLDPGAVNEFVATGGSVVDLALALTGSYQPTASVTFNKPAGWATYEITVWGAAVVRSDALKATPTAVGVRASVGANNGTERGALVGGGFDLEVSARAKFPGLAGSSNACSIDVQKTTPDSAVVQAAHVSYLAVRTT